jgi:hypothetical protein
MLFTPYFAWIKHTPWITKYTDFDTPKYIQTYYSTLLYHAKVGPTTLSEQPAAT